MRVLVACERSGVVRDAFIRRGHDAVSCDLEPTQSPGPHIQGNVVNHLKDGWDLMIAHPPCTYLAASGARWWAKHQKEQGKALWLVRRLLNAPIPRICIENPVSAISTHIRKADQLVHPWMFGQNEDKTICLWLKDLPPLAATKPIFTPSRQSIHFAPDSPGRSEFRSRTFKGFADAMASQWGALSDASGLRPPASRGGG